MAGTAQEPAREQYAAELAAALLALYAAMKVDILDRAAGGIKGTGLVVALWAARLTGVLADRIKPAAADIGERVAAELGDAAGFDPAIMDHYLQATAENHASSRVDQIRTDAAGALQVSSEALQAVLDEIDAQVEEEARQAIQTAANFGSIEAARQLDYATKTWKTGSNPRPSHAALDGTTVALEAVFPNGLAYPGAPGPPAEVVNCNCTLAFGRSDD